MKRLSILGWDANAVAWMCDRWPTLKVNPEGHPRACSKRLRTTAPPVSFLPRRTRPASLVDVYAGGQRRIFILVSATVGRKKSAPFTNDCMLPDRPLTRLVACLVVGFYFTAPVLLTCRVLSVQKHNQKLISDADLSTGSKS